MNPIISSREPRSMQDWMRDNPFTRQARLAASPPFRQAGPEGQRRMSENVQKGLPANIDPQRIFVSGYTGGGTIPQYSAVMGAMGFGGGWGSVGMDRMGGNNMSQLPPTSEGRPTSQGTVASGGGPQPTEGVAADIARGIAPTLGGATSQISSLANPQVPAFPQTEKKEDNNPYSNERALARRRQRLGF
jgi:hypothetical protein